MSCSHLRSVVVILHLLLLLLLPWKSESELSPGYYRQSCPEFYQIIQDIVIEAQSRVPTTAAASLRLLLHDCFVGGCDASILLSSTASTTAERDADVNLSLAGGGFDIISRAKAKLELACNGTVSCADILVAVTRDLLTIIGGPSYGVGFGRKDSLTSYASLVSGNIPLPTMSTDEIIAIFKSKGLSVEEMVVLSGAHSIGLSHCSQFANQIYNFSGSTQSDPSYNPRFSQSLRNACSNYSRDSTMSVANDVITPNQFDNQYFKNLPKGLGLLSSDRGLHLSPLTRPSVEMYANDNNVFFDKFRAAMEKLSVLGVKDGKSGEVRRRCDVVNPA